MGAESEILQTIAGSTNSDLIRLFLILAVCLLPMYVFIFRDRKYRQDNDIKKQKIIDEHEDKLLTIIKENSTIIGEFKAITEKSSDNLSKSLVRIHDRIDNLEKVVAALNDILIKMNTTADKNMENSKMSQGEMKAILHDILAAISKLIGIKE